MRRKSGKDCPKCGDGVEFEDPLCDRCYYEETDGRTEVATVELPEARQ